MIVDVPSCTLVIVCYLADINANFVAMDDCGLRYVLAVGHDTYLMKTLSPAQRLQFQTSGFSFSDIIWGFHSESEEVIIVYF